MPAGGINITHVVVNEHAPIFAELIEVLADALGRLGHSVSVSANHLAADRLNVLVGHTTFLAADTLAAARASGAAYVVFQSEVLDDGFGFAARNPAYAAFLATARRVWDYAPANLPVLARWGCRDAVLVPIGYAARLERIAPAPTRDADVLFYGRMNARRRAVRTGLEDRGVRVRYQFGVYGPDRDLAIAGAKVVLNVHQFDAPQLEQVRLAYLLNNRAFVVSEPGDCDPYGGGVVFRDYGELVDTCVAYLRPEMDAERDRIAGVGYEALKRVPMVEALRAALAGLGAGGG